MKRLYFSSLDEDGKAAYEKFHAALRDGKRRIPFSERDIEALRRFPDLLSQATLENYDLVDCDGRALSGQGSVQVGNGWLYIDPTVFLEKKAAPSLRQAREDIVSLTSGIDDYWKAVAVHDYIASRTLYDETEPRAFTPDGPFLEGKGVCKGMALAASFLFDAIGIESAVIDASKDGVGHALNIVYLREGEKEVPMLLDITPDCCAEATRFQERGREQYALSHVGIGLSLDDLRSEGIACPYLESLGPEEQKPFLSPETDYYRRSGLYFSSPRAYLLYVGSLIHQGSNIEVELDFRAEGGTSQAFMRALSKHGIKVGRARSCYKKRFHAFGGKY